MGDAYERMLDACERDKSIRPMPHNRQEVYLIGAGYEKPISYLAQLARICTNRQTHSILTTLQKRASNCNFPYKDIAEIKEDNDLTTVINALDNGHNMVIEGLTFQYYIQNISRACLAQLTTHRLVFARLTQSQRYNKYGAGSDFWQNHYIPALEYLDEEKRILAYAEFRNAYDEDMERYQRLTALGVKPEDNRFHTAQAAPTSLTLGLNLRELLTVLFPLRSSVHAQAEIRLLANNMMIELYRCYTSDKMFVKFLHYYEQTWLPRMRGVHKEWI